MAVRYRSRTLLETPALCVRVIETIEVEGTHWRSGCYCRVVSRPIGVIVETSSASRCIGIDGEPLVLPPGAHEAGVD